MRNAFFFSNSPKNVAIFSQFARKCRKFFPNLGQGPFPKIAEKSPAWTIHSIDTTESVAKYKILEIIFKLK